jgi:hypothetical protein
VELQLCGLEIAANAHSRPAFQQELRMTEVLSVTDRLAQNYQYLTRSRDCGYYYFGVYFV